MEIKINNFKKLYTSAKDEIDSAIQEVLDSWEYIKWKQDVLFEEEFAKKNWSKYCIWVWNWLDALKISLLALWVWKWDEVITTSHSAIATTLAILEVWAEPVFVDVDKYSCIDTSLIEEKITDKTKAIMPVHIYWNSCNMKEMKEICDKYNLYLIEDCAQSHFTEYNWIKLWNYWELWCFSFYPSKNIWAFWDAWCIVTNDEDLYEKCKLISNYWHKIKYKHIMLWMNSRLDEIQAAILRVQLKHIDEYNKRRQEIAWKYIEWLKWIKEIQVPEIRENSTHTFHLFVIQCERRDELINYLQEKWIESMVHYPISIHHQPVFNWKYENYNLPVLDNQVQKNLSLPMNPFLTDEEVDYVISNIKDFYNN